MPAEESSGAVVSSGQQRRAEESRGEQRRAEESSGEHWPAVVGSGGQWRPRPAEESSGEQSRGWGMWRLGTVGVGSTKKTGYV